MSNGETIPASTDEGNSKSHRKPSPADFMFGSTLGEGAYARVVHAKMKASGDEFAVKIMEKRFIKKENKVKFVMMERKVFSKVSHPHIVKLYFTFQDKNYLYMVMEICRGGELLDVIMKHHDEQVALGNQNSACSLDITRFYIAEIVLALEYLHSNSIIHRDLKPENILLTESGHLKLTDFGTAKDESSDEERHNTFCGTAEYVSPEVLRDQEASKGCDLWAVGCMVYQMLVGRPMFRAENEYLTFQQILHHPAEDFAYPDSFPATAKDLCDKLLQQTVADRLGAGSDEEGNGYYALKAHPFFDGIDWENLSNSTPPYIPSQSSLPPTDNDGATDDWLFAGVATELQVSTMSPQAIMRGGQNQAFFNEAQPIVLNTPSQTRSDSLWNRFLLDHERILMSSLISKRKGLFSKKRQLILTSTPRLIYIDPIRMKQKGEIPWSDQLYVQVKNSTSFDVVTPNRVYHISDQIQGAQKWAQVINEALIGRR